jgi:hypothetical protein
MRLRFTSKPTFDPIYHMDMMDIAGANLQDGDGRNPIGSGFAWMINADSHDSDQFPALQRKICPPFSEFTSMHSSYPSA